MATKATPVQQEEQELVNPWMEKVSIQIPRGAGKDDTQFVCVNGRTFLVPKGRTVQVPLPVAEVLENADYAKRVSEERKIKKASK